jgi:hypothetical protein
MTECPYCPGGECSWCRSGKESDEERERAIERADYLYDRHKDDMAGRKEMQG